MNEPKMQKKKEEVKENKKEEKMYLSKRGYVIKKKELNETEKRMILHDLIVKPFVMSNYNGVEEDSFKVYLENENKFYVPKFYGIEKFGMPQINMIPEGKDIDLPFKLELKKEQIEPAEKTMEAYRINGGGILSLPCGFGKTIMALYFISQLKKKTLVIVHKEFLMNQWIERITMALPNAKVGIIQADKFQVENKDIVIGMLQTLSMKEFDNNAFDDFGHVIIDECHTISSRIFSKALFKINAKYMLGISATPNRSDGLMKVLKYHIGETFFTIKSNEKNVVKVERYLIQSKNTSYNEEVTNFKYQPQMATMLNNIADFYNRSKIIINRVIDDIKSNEKRQFLILSDRKSQLEMMYKIVIEYNNKALNLSENQSEIINNKPNDPISVGYYIGGLKKNVLKENEKCKILLGTYPMASTGLDIPTLNGLVLATPRSDIIQSIGRIDRIIHINIQPIIIDVCDLFSMFSSQASKRLSVYKKKGYSITDITYNVDNMSELYRKNYFYHIVKEDKKNKKRGDSESEEEEINLDELDPLTYKKKFTVKNKTEEEEEEEEESLEEKEKEQKIIEELFSKRSLFS